MKKPEKLGIRYFGQPNKEVLNKIKEYPGKNFEEQLSNYVFESVGQYNNLQTERKQMSNSNNDNDLRIITQSEILDLIRDSELRKGNQISGEIQVYYKDWEYSHNNLEHVEIKYRTQPIPFKTSKLPELSEIEIYDK